MPKLSPRTSPPAESDHPRSTGNRPVEEARVAIARPHPEGAVPYELEENAVEAEADLGEQPSDANPISSKSGP